MPPASTPIGVVVSRERARDLHHRAVAAEREHGVVVRRVHERQLRRVAGPLREHDVALDRPRVERVAGALGEPKSAARCRVRDDDGAL